MRPSYVGIEVELPASIGKLVSVPSVVQDSSCLYDQAGNRTSEQINNGVSAAMVNNLNQVTGISPSGPIHFTGTLNEPANVTVNGVSAAVDSSNNFAADIPLSAGANVVTVAATNGNGVKTTKHYQYTVANGVSRTLTYDLDGNLVNDGAGKTYTYDAANRLTSITQGSNVSGFVYDGSGRRVQETLNGSVIKQWIWLPGAAQPCEERDASNNVTKRFYGQGEILLTGANAGTYYFSKDHLGSIREVTNSSATLVARYDYDPYGRRTLVSGTDLADFGFTGFYYHQASGLDLTLNRSYDPNLGRWLSRDTLDDAELSQGANLYGYVGNNPVLRVDRDGRFWWVAIGAAIGGALSAYHNYADYKSGKISGEQYAALIGVGAVGGAISTLAPGVLGGALLGGATSGLQSLVDNEIKGESADFATAGKEALFGTAGGVLSGLAGNLGEDIIRVPDQIGKELGSEASLVQDLGEPVGLIADTTGDLIKDELFPDNKNQCGGK